MKEGTIEDAEREMECNIEAHNGKLQEYQLLLEAAGIRVVGAKEGTDFDDEPQIDLGDYTITCGADGMFFLNHGDALCAGEETLEELIPEIQKELG